MESSHDRRHNYQAKRRRKVVLIFNFIWLLQLQMSTFRFFLLFFRPRKITLRFVSILYIKNPFPLYTFIFFFWSDLTQFLGFWFRFDFDFCWNCNFICVVLCLPKINKHFVSFSFNNKPKISSVNVLFFFRSELRQYWMFSFRFAIESVRYRSFIIEECL